MQEIQKRQWRTLCERLIQLRRGSLITVAFLDRSGNQREVAKDASLETLDYDPSGDCSDRISLGVRRDRKCDHPILEPLRIRLREGMPGRVNGIAFEAENGTTLVTFPPVARAELTLVE